MNFFSSSRPFLTISIALGSQGPLAEASDGLLVTDLKLSATVDVDELCKDSIPELSNETELVLIVLVVNTGSLEEITTDDADEVSVSSNSAALLETDARAAVAVLSVDCGTGDDGLISETGLDDENETDESLALAAFVALLSPVTV